ncbi:MAG TPA: L-2-hydroxyglutarate oxidase [Solirubrobacteraceae bacterium]|nr:L-2-hydroxyglutarate oxidase [Solirubrobacteraceae bacterium]
MSAHSDFAVVGAGILGLAVARELLIRRPRRHVLVLEQANDLAPHQTSHNSGVIHAGVYYAPGSLKAELCVTGAERLYDYCERNSIEARPIGKLIIATTARELAGLEELERRARANRVPGIRRLTAAQLAELEPHARGLAALHSPRTGIVDFRAVCRQLATDVREAGGELRLAWRVSDAREDAHVVRLSSGADAVEARTAVFCAGLWADRLAVAMGAPRDPRIVPFRGAYLRLRPDRQELVRGLIYPVPDPALPFLGVHLTPTVHGEVLLGPTALLVGARDAYSVRTLRPRDLLDTVSWPGTWRMARRWWRTGAHEIRLATSRHAFADAATRYIPEITAEDLLPGPAGVRAQALSRGGRLVDDFVLSATARTVHVRNAPSPAATSALALAARIADAAEQREP